MNNAVSQDAGIFHGASIVVTLMPPSRASRIAAPPLPQGLSRTQVTCPTQIPVGAGLPAMAVAALPEMPAPDPKNRRSLSHFHAERGNDLTSDQTRERTHPATCA